MRLRVVLAVFAVLTVLAVGGVYLLAHKIGSSLPLPVLVQECTANAGGVATLDPEQMANAATIAAVGARRGVPERAVQIALATAAQESKLRNLDGGDRDSIGLFQQRPSQGWGTPEQISDPRYAANRFYTALLRVKGWQQMPLATAAQHVQRSADGSAYAVWETEAKVLSSALFGDTGSAVACVLTDQPAKRGAAAVQSVEQSLTLDWGKIDATGTSAPAGVQVTVDATRTGWRYAHWLVAHADDQGIKSVSYGTQRWTAKTGNWSKAPSAGTPANSMASVGSRVVAEVYD
ncbi:MAG TPA: hypothetical protein VJT31_24650 [Rugosimonospora sp.]|nr:hypothetical protein [Rugosimonospora sp.]